MDRFRYLRDPLFLTGCMAYALNRWWLKALVVGRFMHGHFSDLWLIPCALPPVLWLHRRAGWRSHDGAPTLLEVFSHWVVWSVVCEALGPRWLHRSTSDPWDVLAYGAGGVVAWAIWRWRIGRWPAIP